MFTANEVLYIVFTMWITVHTAWYMRWWWGLWKNRRRPLN